MSYTRRTTLTGALAAGAVLPAARALAQGSARTPAGIEGQRRADLGNGRYLNPVIAGDRPDPNVLKDGDAYYAAFSSFQYYPGVPIWHSRDLVNWSPLTAALKTPVGVVWALDIAKHDGRYFIYIPALDPGDTQRGIKTWVIHADSMAGPWSEPVDMHIDNLIDPGHAVGEDGNRYLFFNGGNRVRLTPDGLAADGPVTHVYDGWPIPENYVIEGFALEGPKITRHGDWFYMFSGQGGTAGPPTSHMVVVARARSIDGPWENCPHNPIVRTTSRQEPWWSRGHATAVEGPGGQWWLIYHGYENGYRTLGRQMLLEPIAWGEDGWPRALGGDLSRPLPAPAGASPAQRPAGGQKLSGFDAGAIGPRFTVFDPRPGYLDRVRMTDGALHLAGQGSGPADASPVLFVAGDHAYEITVEVERGSAGQAGLVLFYDPKLFCGLGLGTERLHAWRIGNEERWPPGADIDAERLWLRVVNDRNVATFLYSRDGKAWHKDRSVEVSCYNHNIADGFLSLRPGFYATNGGQATFRNLTYRALPDAGMRELDPFSTE